ncbi:acyl-CoA dehydrogenase family protein [Luedemannella helvata]|uniref:acyl-CoA dehydrogenase family protein n=1 Tax=Luedemannella helvata TaxID=349315 RepID=UPI0031DC345E
MDLKDDADEATFRSALRDWLVANAATDDRRAWSRALYDAGYAGLTWPTEHGGAGLPARYQAILAEECARAGASDHHNVIGLNMVGPSLIRFGTPAQQATHLRRILTGEDLFCQGFSEPDAGSDLAAVRTRAVPVPGGYMITGEKVWSSYAHLADFCLLLARTGPEASRHAGLTCFLLNLRTAGVTVRPLRMITGDADFGQIVLDDVRVGDDAVLGEPGGGWRVAMTTLAHERGTFGITLTARLVRAFDRLLTTVRDVGAEHDPLVRRTVAELYVDVLALRHTGYRALSTMERSGMPGPESSVLKLHWSHTHQRLVAFAARLAAASGEPTWTAYWQHEQLRSRGNTLEGGTSEVLRGVIAEHVAGLPRSR